MSNLKLGLLVFTVFCLIIFFGRNPADEIRKKRAERAGRSLIAKIEEANKKRNGASGFTGGGMGGRTPNPYASYPANNRYAKAGMQKNNGSNAMNGPSQFHAGGYNPRNPGANPNNTAAPVDDYYPPAPRNKNIQIPLSSLPAKKNGTTVAESQEIDPMVAAAYDLRVADKQVNQMVQKTLADRNRTTDDGQNLTFHGPAVFTYDANGQLKPMPDGKYTMYDGNYTMVVRGGMHVIPDSHSIW